MPVVFRAFDEALVEIFFPHPFGHLSDAPVVVGVVKRQTGDRFSVES